MKEPKRYCCGNGEGMFEDDKKGHWVEYSEHKAIVMEKGDKKDTSDLLKLAMEEAEKEYPMFIDKEMKGKFAAINSAMQIRQSVFIEGAEFIINQLNKEK